MSAIQLSNAQAEKKSLAQVRCILVKSLSTFKSEEQVLAVEKALKQYGFESTKQPEKADAVLSGELQLEITIEGDGSIPDRSRLICQLEGQDHTAIWKYRVNFVSKKSLIDDLQYGANRVAKRLVEAVQKS